MARNPLLSEEGISQECERSIQALEVSYVLSKSTHMISCSQYPLRIHVTCVADKMFAWSSSFCDALDYDLR